MINNIIPVCSKCGSSELIRADNMKGALATTAVQMYCLKCGNIGTPVVYVPEAQNEQ